MAGNSKRKGAVRTGASRKGSSVGSGGQRRKQLKGKGPTPKAVDREGHITKKRADRAARQGAKSSGSTQSSGAGSSRVGVDSTSGVATKSTKIAGRSSVAAPNGNEFVLGRNPVVEALSVNVPARVLYVQAKIDPDSRVDEALAHAVKNGVEVREAPKRLLDDMAQGIIHQGLILEALPYQYVDLVDVLERRSKRHSGMVVALDGITDPHNLGAIVRSTGAFEGTGIVLPERRSASVTAAAWRTSAGALAHLEVAQVKNLSRAIAAAKKAGFFVIGLAGEAVESIAAADIGELPVLLIVGSEGAGLSRLVAESCDLLVKIPISSNIESLNASVATGVALYELSKQRTAGTG